MPKVNISKTLSEKVSGYKSRRGNVYTFKRGYFYHHGATSMTYAIDVFQKACSILPECNVKIVDNGNHWHAFVGGAKEGSAQDSYLYAKLEITPHIAAEQPSAPQNAQKA